MKQARGVAHVARPNPHWERAGGPTVAIFQGPQSYISPSWYPTKRGHGRVVPTWNDIAVHAHGTLEVVDDEAWPLAHLDDLTRENEDMRAAPWQVADAPAEFIRGFTRAIVGLRLRVTRAEGAWKLIQHRSEADRLGTIEGLEAEGGQDIARAMPSQEAARGTPWTEVQDRRDPGGVRGKAPGFQTRPSITSSISRS